MSMPGAPTPSPPSSSPPASSSPPTTGESTSSPPPTATPPPANQPPPSSSPPPSSPPPPSSNSSPSPPPATTAIPSPPQSSPPPPSSPSPPPPTQPSSSAPPPTISSSSGSPPPPTSTGPSNHVSPPPPPPPKSHTPSLSSHTPSSGSPSSQQQSSSSLSSSQYVNIVIGVAAGAGVVLIVLMILLILACTRKKKKPSNAASPTNYYGGNPDGPKVGENYYQGTPHNQYYSNWNNSPQPQAHVMHMSPPPAPGAFHHLASGSGWPTPPPPYSGEMSSSVSGSNRYPGLQQQESSIKLGFNKSTFSYEELAAATGGFSRDNVIGQGGFGYVHKGALTDGREIAVKCLKSGSGQGDREFQAEVDIISRVHHRHLVSLVGYCIAGSERILVYEFVPNKTLEHHLHGKGVPPMDWPTRLRIAVGSAKGLAYLHEDCHPRIIHRDIKTANILIDFNYEAKVADFGLAKLSSDNYTHVSTRIMGTFGYLAPEYAASGKLTEKSDVFSFGVMLLELITGRRPVDTTGEYDMDADSLVDWARPLITNALAENNFSELVDRHLEGNYNHQEMARMVACAGACVRHSARRRPKMSQVVRALEGDVSFDDLSEWAKPTGQSTTFSGSSSNDYGESGSYSMKMRQFRKIAFESQEYASSEYGLTSEYGLNPSVSSSSMGSNEHEASKSESRRKHSP